MAAFTERAADSLAASMIFDTSPKTARYGASSPLVVAVFSTARCSGLSGLEGRPISVPPRRRPATGPSRGEAGRPGPARPGW